MHALTRHIIEVAAAVAAAQPIATLRAATAVSAAGGASARTPRTTRSASAAAATPATATAAAAAAASNVESDEAEASHYVKVMQQLQFSAESKLPHHNFEVSCTPIFVRTRPERPLTTKSAALQFAPYGLSR